MRALPARQPCLRSMHRPLGGTLRSDQGVKSANATAEFHRRIGGK